MEEWKAVPIAPRYEANSEGAVRNAETKRVLQPQLRADGYLQFCLYVGPGDRIYRKRSQIIASAFLGPKPDPKMVVAHKDGSRTNDRAENLYWATQKQNHADREAHGRAPKGSRNGAASLSEAEVTRIRERLKLRHRQDDIAADFGVCPATISNINTGKYWRHV